MGSATGSFHQSAGCQNACRPILSASNDSAEIAIHPNGKFLYESNRRFRGPDMWGPDTIGVFAIDPVKGTLTEVEQVPPRRHHAAQFRD